MTRALRGRPPWAAVEWAYVSTSAPVRRIAAMFAIPVAALRDEIKGRGWKRRPRPAAPASVEAADELARRLGKIAAHQIAALERQMKRARPDEPVEPRRLGAIAALARVIERMAEVEAR